MSKSLGTVFGGSGMPDERQQCCKFKNLEVATPDGKLPSNLICLVCKTCQHAEPFLFSQTEFLNVAYAFAEWVEIGRVK